MLCPYLSTLARYVRTCAIEYVHFTVIIMSLPMQSTVESQHMPSVDQYEEMQVSECTQLEV